MQCDMCGSNHPLVRAKIEGTVMDVCKNCAGFGEIVRVPRPIHLNKTRHIAKIKQPERIDIIVPNYYTLIRNAREKKGMKQEEVAKKISEKESLYHRIENGQTKPSISLAKKLENFFKIKLVEEYKNKMQATIASAPTGKTLTIGDMMRIKK